MDIEHIREICTKMAGVTEEIKWGHDLVFMVGGKMFCVVGLDELPTPAAFKVKEEEFPEMSQRAGFKPAPYVAKYKWIRAEDIRVFSKAEWAHYLTQSYTLVSEKLSAKIKKEIACL